MFFMADTRVATEMYPVHVQAASVHQPFQGCKCNFFKWFPNYLCSMQHFFLGFSDVNLIPDVNSLSVKVLIFQEEKR